MKKNIEAWKAQTPYPVEYLHNGSRWALTIYAVDDEDAAAKIQSLRASAQLAGGATAEIIAFADDHLPQV